jgi:hypothetical protein
MVSLILPYLCLQLSMCRAQAERGSLFFIYHMFSRNLDLNLRLVFPTFKLFGRYYM